MRDEREHQIRVTHNLTQLSVREGHGGPLAESYVVDVGDLLAEVDRLRRMLSLAYDRVGAQSELLSRHAERKDAR